MDETTTLQGWEIKKSLAAVTLASTGTMSPAETKITSPGTSYAISISGLAPFLRTVATVATLFINASAWFCLSSSSPSFHSKGKTRTFEKTFALV